MSNVTITIGELVILCAFAGIEVDKTMSVFADDPEQFETCLTIHQKAKVCNDDGQEIYEGIAATFTDYPEDGTCPLIF